MNKNIITRCFIALLLTALFLVDSATAKPKTKSKPEKCPVICRQKFMKEISILSTDKKSADKLVRILEKANAQTDVHIYLRNGGGELLAGERIIDAMHASKGRTIVEVIDRASSMGAIITLNADVILTKSDTLILFHMPRSRAGICKLSSKHEQFQNCAKYFLTKYGYTIQSLLSKPQWRRFLAGRNVHISGDDLVDRLAKAKLLPRKRR